MFRPSGISSLRHLFGVVASTSSKTSVARASKIASIRFAEIDPGKFRVHQDHYQTVEAEETAKHLVSLRVGGAKVLAPAYRDVMVQPQRSPLHFAPVRPRDAGLCQQLCVLLAKLKIRKLTELQGALVPELLRGRHILGHAETGSGKSFGIALAACNRMLRQQTSTRLHTLILVPTDALALQYERWLRHFAGSSRQVVLAAVSQYPLADQLAQLHNVQPHVLVGTPQRLSEIATLCPVIIGERLRSKVDCIVLDEADVLLKTPITPPNAEDEKAASDFEQRHHSSRVIGGGLGRAANRRNNDSNSASNVVLSCSELIDRLYRCDSNEMPAQIVATSATFDGETSARLNTWMRNETVTRLTTSIEEQALPPTLSFHMIAEQAPTYPMHRVLKTVLHHIACQRRRAKILVFADPQETDIDDLCRFISQLRRLPSATFAAADANPDSAPSPAHHERWKCVSLMADFQDADAEGKTERNPEQEVSRQQRTTSTSNHRKIFGRNGEIFSFNDSNLSWLETGKDGTCVGVASYELARGLHIAGVTHVITYGAVPGAMEFLHCAGRTGRRGKAGEVISIFPPGAGRMMKSICDTLNIPWHTNRPADVEKALQHSIAELEQRNVPTQQS